MSDRPEVARGTQLERTVLSWQRVAIAVAANGALLMRSGFVHHVRALEAFGLAIAVGAFGLWALSLRRYGAIAGGPVAHLFRGRAGAALPLATFVLALSLVDVVVVIFAR